MLQEASLAAESAVSRAGEALHRAAGLAAGRRLAVIRQSPGVLAAMARCAAGWTMLIQTPSLRERLPGFWEPPEPRVAARARLLGLLVGWRQAARRPGPERVAVEPVAQARAQVAAQGPLAATIAAMAIPSCPTCQMTGPAPWFDRRQFLQ